jgi:putative protease
VKKSDIEIMAPAGSWESLHAAVSGGADSVYFGVEKMNMRARSSHNFTAADLPEIVDYCKKHGLLSYLTLNIVVYDEEIGEMNRLLDEASKAGVTAVIATDQAAILAAREKGIGVHLSTQLNVSNYEALKFYSGWADVAVLSRELNLQQVKMIHEAINSNNILGPGGRPVRLEMFVHGALCMAVSGKCYLSLHEYNASANRGNCYQTCRRGYTVRDRETGYELDIDNQYIMSPKDLCTIGFLDQIIDAGARVLKIEGRARPPEYVETVSRCYGEAAAAVADGTFGREKVEGWMNQLESVFNRGFWDGYYLGQRFGEWTTTYGSSATKRKIYLGKVTNYFPRPGVAEIKLETGSIKEGDQLLITGPSTGLVWQTVTGLRDASENDVVMVPRGEVCSVKTDEKVRRYDRVFRWIDASDLKQE